MDIDRSKENIQPLRGGRNATHLGAALTASADADAARHLHAQQRELEMHINSYDGPDPLEPWFNYIQWIEQCFPKHGHEGHIDKLIKECLTKFENDERYLQDRRFLRLWIKYIGYSNNPLEFYQGLYTRGTGTKCAELYRAWACYAEEAEDYVKADQVYKLGLQNNAEPREELEQALREFQVCCTQRLLHNDSPTKRKAESALMETRLALTTLRTVKRRNTMVVPSQRTGENICNIGPGMLRQTPDVTNVPRSNVMVNVYNDKPGPSSFPVNELLIETPATTSVPSLLQSISTVENQKEVGIWTNSSKKSDNLEVRKNSADSLPFTLFEDDHLILPPDHVSYCKEDFSNFCVPIFVPDPPDSTKIPQYNKKEVYKEIGSTIIECSLEEIRARNRIQKYKNKKDIQQNTASLHTSENMKPFENLESENFEYLTSETKNEFKIENVIAQSNSILNADDQHNGEIVQNEEYLQTNKQLFNEKPANNCVSAVDSCNVVTNNLGFGCEEGKIKRNYDDFNASLLANLHGNDSMTYHTKEAHRELNLFTENNDSGFNVAEFEPIKFDIREDHSMTMAAVPVKVDSKLKNTPENNIENHKIDNDFNYISETKQVADENYKNYYAEENFPVTNNVQNPVNFDESTTAMFSINVQSASTPCNNYFKTPQFVDSTKRTSIKSFDMGENANTQEKYSDQNNFNKPSTAVPTEMNRAGNNNGLYPIMETTRENRSSSSSSGCNQTSGNTLFGYTARESSGQVLSVISEKTNESVTQEAYYHQYQDPNAYNKRQNRMLAKGNIGQNQIHKNFNFAVNNEDKMHSTITSSQNNLSTPSQYSSLDHQYHKTNPSFNRYGVQNVPQNYQGINQLSTGNNGYQNHATYQNSSVNNYQTVHQNPQMNYNQHNNYQNNQQNIRNSSHMNATDFHSPQNAQHGYQNVQSHTYQNNHQNYAATQGYANSQQNFAGSQQGYSSPQQHYNSNSQVMTASPQHNYANSQGFTSPQHGFGSSPQHNYANSQHGFTSPQHGFTSPQHNYMNSQQGYSSPQQGFTSPQHSYSTTQGYQKHVYSNQNQHVYSGTHMQSPGFQSPPHVPQSYNSHQAMQNTSHNYSNMNAMHINQQYQPHYYQNNSNVQTPYHNRDHNYSSLNNQNQYNHNPMSNHVQTPTGQNNSKQMNVYNNYHNVQNQQNYPVYKNTNNLNSSQVQFQENVQMFHDYSSEAPLMQNQQYQNASQNISNNQYNDYQTHKQPAVSQSQFSPRSSDAQKYMYQSSTAKLRSVRHEVPNIAGKHNNSNVSSPSTNPGYSNQYLNFISSRNEPKDNANTPKFNNSPNISQKMNKNLYVSSPEQGQIPPSTEINNAEISKESALQTSLLNQSHSITAQNVKEKYRDYSKRQLDFEIKTELQSEDSRDSIGKMSRISSTRSRQSIQSMHTDGENSSDSSTAFRSNLNNSTISTQDIPLPADIEFPKVIDPFNIQLCNSLLQYVKFPNKNHYEGYYEVKSVGKFQQGVVLPIGRYKFTIEKQLGKGTFGSVFKGIDNTNNEGVALKFQKPGHPWEYYICQEIKARIRDSFMLPGYMDIRVAVFSDNTSIFVSELSIYGSLLDVANKIKAATTKCISEFIVMLMASEMLSIVHHLHKVQIIHGDIKPDNFLVMKTPQTESRAPSLQLIDFGCAIDMSLFPEGTTFKKVISTDGFTCTEMRDGRPWTYQTDLYCLAGTVYVILMGNYMQTTKKGGQWVVEKKWPRYMKSEVWDKIFTPLLNVKDCSNIPDLLSLKAILDEFLISVDSNLINQLRNFDHILKRK